MNGGEIGERDKRLKEEEIRRKTDRQCGGQTKSLNNRERERGVTERTREE
jgi:hypothetical protein